MLLVIGVNHESMLRVEHCWVSPLALDLVKSAQASGVALAYYVFDFEIRSSIFTAMNILLLQLLRLQHRPNMDTLFSQLEKYRSELSSSRRSGNGYLARKTLEEVAVTITQLMERRQKVWIIVDRVDRCERKEQRDFLSILVRLLEGARCCLKIFAVANKTYWDVAEYQMQQLANSPNFKPITETQRQSDDEE